MKQVLYKILFPFVNKKYNLEWKWWHRLLKVIFTFLIIVTFIISLFFYYWTNEKNNFFKWKSSWFSLIPTANADNNTNFIDELNYDIKNWATREEIKQAYPELNNNDTLINELHYDISNWATIDEIRQAYPELSWYNWITQS